jgi:hypothetical protein
MSNLKARINKLVKSIGLGEPFKEGVGPGDNFGYYGFLGTGGPRKPGTHFQTHQEAPAGFKKAAFMMGLSLAVITIFSERRFRGEPRYEARLAKSKKALGLTGDESAQTVLDTVLRHGREAGFNAAEMAELKEVISGNLARVANDPWKHAVNSQANT